MFGHGRKYLTALIEIDFDSVADWARAHDVNYTGFTSLVQNEAVTGLIKAEIDKANARIRAESSRSRAFASCRRNSIPNRTASR